jgi:hypothetical protein
MLKAASSDGLFGQSPHSVADRFAANDDETVAEYGEIKTAGRPH